MPLADIKEFRTFEGKSPMGIYVISNQGKLAIK